MQTGVLEVESLLTAHELDAPVVEAVEGTLAPVAPGPAEQTWT
jgi:hypothetical protein